MAADSRLGSFGEAPCAISNIMRRLLLLVTIASAAVTLIISTPAWATSTGANVSGIGTLGQFGDPTVRVGALETTDGVLGSFQVTYPDNTIVDGTASCLFVSGNTAYLTGRISAARGPRETPNGWFPGSYIIIGVADNGGAGPDLLNFSPGFASNPGCGPNFAATPAYPIVSGHYVVKAG